MDTGLLRVANWTTHHHLDSKNLSLTMFSLNMVDYLMFSLLLSNWILVEEVILSHFYSLSFFIGGLLHSLKLLVGRVVGWWPIRF